MTIHIFIAITKKITQYITYAGARELCCSGLCGDYPCGGYSPDTGRMTRWRQGALGPLTAVQQGDS